MDTVSSYLERLTSETQKPEAEVLALAVRTGLRHLWREHILGRYLRGEITRAEAIADVGPDWVELAKRQRDAMMEDVAWALGDQATLRANEFTATKEQCPPSRTEFGQSEQTSLAPSQPKTKAEYRAAFESMHREIGRLFQEMESNQTERDRVRAGIEVIGARIDAALQGLQSQLESLRADKLTATTAQSPPSQAESG
jgi:hypothetical protein